MGNKVTSNFLNLQEPKREGCGRGGALLRLSRLFQLEHSWGAAELILGLVAIPHIKRQTGRGALLST